MKSVRVALNDAGQHFAMAKGLIPTSPIHVRCVNKHYKLYVLYVFQNDVHFT